MIRYRRESAKTTSGVLISLSRLSQKVSPAAISARQTAPLMIMDVETAVFMSR